MLERNLQYAERSYWDERFKTERHFEWLTGFDNYNDVLLKRLSTTDDILHIGCGSSDLSIRLKDIGFSRIANVDYSQVLIEAQSERYPEMKWICEDITSLATLPDASYDVVVEKATIEALLVAEKSPWSPSDSALTTLDSVWAAVSRVLRPGGRFLSISFTQPHFRLPALLRNKDWGVTFEEFGSGFHFYLYECRKGATTPAEVLQTAALAKDWTRIVQ